MANRAIVIGAIGITSAGVISAAVKRRPVTPVVIGGYMVALIGSLVDLIPGAGVLAGSIVMAAMFGIFLVDVPWDAIFGRSATGAAAKVTPLRHPGNTNVR